MSCARVPSAARPPYQFMRWCFALAAFLSLSLGCGDDDKTTDAGIVVSVAPATASVEVNQTQQFTATASGTANQEVSWTVDGEPGNGTINSSGMYTAPATVPNPSTITVTATSDADPSKTGTAVVTVVQGITVSVQPATATVEVGGTQQFTASVTGTGNVSVTWSVDGGADNGTVNATGLYTAPATVPSPAAVTVRATSLADASKSGTATVAIVAPVPLGFVRIEPGMFQMGSPASEADRYSVETQHWVRLTKPFLLGEAEVTQAEYQAVMGTNPSYHQGAQRPVEQVTWFDAVNYCNALSDKEHLTKVYTINGSTVTWNPAANGYRLPTESEWEYACRAGTTTRFWSGETESDLARVGWYYGNSGNQTHDVRGKQANAWGLYDVHGNVWEWCWDWYDTYPAGSQGSPAVDPAGPASKSYRVLRGGSWGGGTYFHRCALRDSGFDPTINDSGLGFRVARTVNP